jgi:hypothetical protein
VRIYFAHAICTYGCPIERVQKKQIRNRFPRCQIIDPGTFRSNPEKSRKRMRFCYAQIDTCDTLVFARLLRKITSGVGREIRHALSKGKRVYELRGEEIKSVKKARPYISRSKSRSLYNIWRRQCGCKKCQSYLWSWN